MIAGMFFYMTKCQSNLTGFYTASHINGIFSLLPLDYISFLILQAVIVKEAAGRNKIFVNI